jgi:uncharacterized protein (DUF2147 family)
VRSPLSLYALAGWLATLHAVPALAAPAGTTGLWLDQAGRAAIDIEPCQGNSVCGTIVWLKEPLNGEGKPKIDIHNQRPELQTRKVCGLMMLYGFSPDGSGGWKEGYIYDPSSGKTYNSQFHLKEDGTLYVRGYIGYSFLGQTQIWTRPSGELVRCS